MSHFQKLDLPKLADKYWEKLQEKRITTSKTILDRIDDSLKLTSWNKEQKDFLIELKTSDLLKKIIIGTPTELEVYSTQFKKAFTMFLTSGSW